MNSVYFACLTCKTYHDAGYRWCYWQLEHPGVVTKGQPVSVEAVLQADEYWNGAELEDEHAQWLRRDLPKIRHYLQEHAAHSLIYDEAQNFLWNDEEMEWLDEEDSEYADMSPRLFVEKLGFTTWEQVMDHVEKEGKRLGIEPTWWYEPELQKAKLKFEALVRERK